MKSLAVFAVVVCLVGLLPGATVYAAPPDPDLQPGFPLQSYQTPGNYAGGPAVAAVVANFDTDPTLEIAISAATAGQLYLWNSDGSFVPAWPARGSQGFGYPAGGNLTGTGSATEIVASFYADGGLLAYRADAEPLAGWPKNATVKGAPPALADVNGDALDEVFAGNYAFKADGTPLAGWPLAAGTDYTSTPAIGDLDGDGDLEIVVASEPAAGVVTLGAFNSDATPVPGFPVTFNGYTDTFPVIGDVDGDGTREIVVVGSAATAQMLIFSSGGVLERTVNLMGTVELGSAPALADLNGDRTPEIVVQTNSHLNVVRGTGQVLAGWPKLLSNSFVMGSSAPVVGDLNGDGQPDIAIVVQLKNSQESEVRVYGADGALLPRFPKPLTAGSAAVPAIADIDLDGRNELIVVGNRMEEKPDIFDKVWVYDLGGGLHGRIEWGQLGGGASHRGVYPTTSPAPRTGKLTFLPYQSKSVPAPAGTIHGRVTQGGGGVAVSLDLLRFDGDTATVAATTVSSPSGYYAFSSVPTLGEGMSYRVRWENTTKTPGLLEAFLTRQIKNYTTGGDAGLSQFDTAGLTLTSPAPNTVTAWPVTFNWQRVADVPEWYTVAFERLGETGLACNTVRIRRTSSLTLASVDPACLPVVGWTVLVDAMDGGVGITVEPRKITIQ